MIVENYTKSGELITENTIIKPTQEMQELIDTLWNTVKNRTNISTSQKKNLQVEKTA